MRTSLLKAALGIAAVAAISCSLAYGQVIPVEGTVSLKGADGKLTAVAGAKVDFYRLDMKVKPVTLTTDKNGHFIGLGFAIDGTYLIVASAQGMQPTWLDKVRVGQVGKLELMAPAGDGSRPTLEEIRNMVSSGKAKVAPEAQPEAEKKKDSAAEKAKKDMEAKNSELQASYTTAVKHYNQGVQLLNSSDVQGALGEFQQAALNIDPSKSPSFASLLRKANASMAETHYMLGIDLFNNKKKDDARTQFDTAYDQINKAIMLGGSEKTDPNLSNDLLSYYDLLFKDTRLLVERYGATDHQDPVSKELDHAEELDPAHKAKWEICKGDIYRLGGTTEPAVAAYKNALTIDPNNLDALYGLGLTLLASQDKAMLQESANYLSDFLSKAPPTDKRVGDVKSTIDMLKAQFNVEAEKPSKRKRTR